MYVLVLDRLEAGAPSLLKVTGSLISDDIADFVVVRLSSHEWQGFHP